MSEIAIRDEAETPYLPTSRLVTRAYEAKSAHQLALSLTKTDFVPASMKDVGNATAAIIMGDELGFTPLVSLRSIYIVHGTPALYARSMVALILSQGHEIWTVTSTPSKVEVHGRRKGSDHTEVSVWTTARAQTAGYTSNKKYQTNPEEMLYSKAASEIARKIGADVLLGIPHSVEDLELENDTDNVVTLKRSPNLSTVSREKQSPVIAEPEFDEPEVKEIEVSKDEPVVTVVPADETPAIATNGVSEKQVKMIGALMSKLGMTDKAISLSYVADVIGREVESRNDLTKQEASLLITALKSDEDVQAPVTPVSPVAVTSWDSVAQEAGF